MHQKKHYIVLIFLSLAVYPVFSQPYEACFSAVTTRGCAPFTVQMIDCSGTSGVTGLPAPFYRYFTGATYITDTFYTYTSPGIYTITQAVANGLPGGGYDDTTIVNYIEVLPSPAPEFTIGLCRNNQVVLTIDESNYEEYFIDYGFGIEDTVPGLGTSTYTYPDTSPRTITVTGNYNPGGCGGAASQTVTPYTDLVMPDLFGLSPGTDGNFELSFNGLPQQVYFIEMDQGAGYAVIDTLTGFSGGAVNTGISDQAGNVCFRIRTTDACNNTLVSHEVCSIGLSVSEEVDRNVLFWDTDNSVFSDFQIYRNNSLIGSESPDISTFIDSSVICGKTYCYKIVGEIFPPSAGLILSVSSDNCVTVTSSAPAPLAIEELTFSASSDDIFLVWTKSKSPVKEYTVFRHSGGTKTIAETTTHNSHFGNTVPGACFSLSYIDSCGNQSPETSLLCPVYLEVTQEESTHELSWTPFSGHFTPVSYIVEVINSENQVISSINTGLSTYYSFPVDEEAENVTYRILVEGTSASHASRSNSVVITYDIQIFVPTIFTPNDDNHNDVFLPRGKYIENYRLVILNRWGEHVFASTDPLQGWDGTFQGNPAPQGAYGFLIEASDKNGNTKTLSGTVTLVR